MSLSEDIQNQAEDYLDGKLTDAAKIAFEDMLTSNKELKDYISINQEMRAHYNNQDWSFINDNSEVEILEAYLKSDEANALKHTIKAVNNTFAKEKATNKKSYFSYFAIAASIVILVGFFMFNQTPSNLEIYADYNDWSSLPSLTTRGNTDNDLLVSGEKAFLDKDYDKAENYFKTYLTTSKSNNANALLYYGISNLELGSHEKAIETFNELIVSETIDSSKGHWYKVLTYLKMDDKEAAIKTLNILVKDSLNYNHKEAQELLNKLKD